MLSDLPFDAPDSPPGWLAAVGAWLIAIAFPLPWVASPFLGWFASWGFSPTINVVPFALAVVVALATITPSRLSGRVRLGYLPAAAGLVALGMAWSWILLVPAAIGLLLAGIRLPDKALRLAGLILLTGTILKVFLIDAGELEGIWRILSFLGLGVALIGIGRLYGPVLRAEAGARAAA